MTASNIAIFIFSLLGFTALALAMPRHNRQLLHTVWPPARRRLFRLAGWVLLAIALGLGMARFHFDVGTVAWLGWLSIAGLVLAFVLPYGPWRQKDTGRSLAKSVGESSRGRRRSVGFRSSTQPTERSGSRRAVGVRAGLVAAALLVPLAGFTWQLVTTPVKPLLREDAIHGEIGPWAFSLAEKEQAPPGIEAMDIPLKEFVIRFCERCDADIRMAYLKVRKPHSPRAAGNSFNGRGREKIAEIPIPVAATTDDQLWLTVEGKDGSIYYQNFAIQTLSPALATFIGDRP